MQRLYSRNQPGFILAAGTPGLRPARKHEAEVGVEFARQPGRLQTLEGEVQVSTGDAIVTGPRGERWPVAAEHFAAKYRAAGRPGRYLSLPVTVHALQLQAPCEVVLGDGASVLRGNPGDWLLDYGDGSLGIVAQTIFDMTYELL